jgi:hypothetical protein
LASFQVTKTKMITHCIPEEDNHATDLLGILASAASSQYDHNQAVEAQHSNLASTSTDTFEEYSPIGRKPLSVQANDCKLPTEIHIVHDEGRSRMKRLSSIKHSFSCLPLRKKQKRHTSNAAHRQLQPGARSALGATFY